MKIFSYYCPVLVYAVTTPSKVAIEIDTDLIGAWQDVPRALLLQIGVEDSDHARIAPAAKAVRRIARNTGARHLVINGFAALADPAARPEPSAAHAILTDLAARLTSRPDDLPLRTLPFGWNKTFRLAISAGEWEQRLTHL